MPLLAEKFAGEAARRVGRSLRFSDKAMRFITAFDWPGNVRELENAVERAALRARGTEIVEEDLPPKLQSKELLTRASSIRTSLSALYSDLPTLEELERRYLTFVLESVGSNRTRAAEVMDIDRRTLYRMAERFGVKLDAE